MSTAHKAVVAGRITRRPDGRIEPELADRQWRENTRLRIDGHLSGSTNGHDDRYTAARTAREALIARLLELDYRERAAELVEVTEVEAAAERMREDVRKVLIRMPDRLARVLPAAAGDRAALHRLLTAECARVLDELAGAGFKE